MYNLKVAIKTKHYSDKTLRAYSGWVKRFQAFTRNKETQSLSPTDVKSFIEHLAIKKQVSASTQNQAFNALLFFIGILSKKTSEIRKTILEPRRKNIVPNVSLDII